MTLKGTYYLLYITPWWVLAPMAYLLTAGVIWALRDYFEGFGYNVALSSQLGDLALIAVVFIGIDILKAGGSVPVSFNNASGQILILILGLLVGAVWIKLEQPKYWGDYYHHTLVAPLLVYLLASLVPAIWVSGTRTQFVAAWILGLVWFCLAIYDHRGGRIDQRQWLEKKGITFINPNR